MTLDLNTLEAPRSQRLFRFRASLAVAFDGMLRAIRHNRIMSALFVSILILRYFLSASGPMVTYIDTSGYYSRACAPWWSLLTGRLHGESFARSFGYPLLMRLCRFNPDTAASSGGPLHQVQILLSVLALGVIGLVGCRILARTAPRLLWMCLFLAFSLSAFIHPWEPTALTEGISNNNFIMLLSMTFLLARPEWGKAEALLTVCLTAGFMFLRDVNVFTGLTLLGAVGVDQLGVRRRPRAAWAELKRHLAPAPRRLLRAPLFILTCGLLVVTGLKLLEMRQHTVVQEINICNFVAYRVLDLPPLRKNFINTFHPPQSVIDFPHQPEKSQDLGALHRWVMQNYRPHHLRFLLSNLATDLEMFTVFTQDFMARAAISIPKLNAFPYSYLYGPDKSQWGAKQFDWRMALAYKTHRFMTRPFRNLVLDHVLWPYILPPLLLLTALFLKLRIGRASLVLPLAFLIATFYIHYGLSIYFDGTEDYRHSLCGSFAMVMVPWLFGFGLTQWAGTMAGRFLKPRPAVIVGRSKAIARKKQK